MGRRGRLVPLAMAAVGVLMTACSWGSSSPEASATAAPSDPAGPPTGSSAGPALSVPVARDLPFAQYGDAVDTLLASTLYTAGDRAAFDATEDETAECMKSQGFEYTPRAFVVPEPWSFPWTSSPIMLPALPEDRDAVATDGYGTDDPEEQRALEESARQPSATPDPNAEYQASLSPQAQAEYTYALYGIRGFDDPDPDPSGGCAGRVFESSPPSAYEPFADLIRGIQFVVQRDVFEDERTADLNAEWSSCMTEAGFDAAPPEEYGRPAPPGPGDAYDLAVVTAPDGSVLWPARGTPADEIPLGHRTLVGSDAEHAIALADFDCRRSSDYVRRFTDILAALEGEFVADHQEELDAMVAAASGA